MPLAGKPYTPMSVVEIDDSTGPPVPPSSTEPPLNPVLQLSQHANHAPPLHHSASGSGDSMSSSEFLYLDSVSSTVLFESTVKKLPRRSLGFSRFRYMVLSMKKKGALTLSYYENEFAYSSEQLPLGSFNLRHDTPIEESYFRLTKEFYLKVRGWVGGFEDESGRAY